jgi:oligoribonuclease
MKRDELLAWIDIETTGLDVFKDNLLEVALLITTQDDEVLVEDNWVLRFNRLPTAEFHPVVEEMHTKNGLWEDCSHSTLDLSNFLSQFEGQLRRTQAHHNSGKFVMAGSGVARFDFKWFEMNHPKIISELFAYYTLDVGVIRRGLELAGVIEIRDDEQPVDNLEHRALQDINDHFNEWLEYKNWFEAANHNLLLNGGSPLIPR